MLILPCLLVCPVKQQGPGVHIGADDADCARYNCAIIQSSCLCFFLSVFLSVCGCIADDADCVTVQSSSVQSKFKRRSFLKIARTLRRSRHGGG